MHAFVLRSGGQRLMLRLGWMKGERLNADASARLLNLSTYRR